MVYHEMGHYLFWTDAERKADAFAFRMVRGLRRPQRRTRLRVRYTGRRQIAGARARAGRNSPEREPSPAAHGLVESAGELNNLGGRRSRVGRTLRRA